MSHPRIIVPGATYLITRRCTERMFLLGAHADSRALFTYCIDEAAERWGVLVRAVVVMSNHVHLVATDVRGNLPRFCHHLFGQVAKAINAATGHVESVFTPAARPNLLQLMTREAMVQEIAYLLANPAKAGLVERAAEWPGLITAAADLVGGQRYTGSAKGNPYLAARRVKVRSMQITPIPGVGDVAAFAADVGAEQLRLEKQARTERRKIGWLVKGAAAVRAEKWFRKPRTGVKLFGVNPTVATARREARIAALGAVKAFRRQYEKALRQFCLGKRRVEFPHGTWKMLHVFRARVAAAIAA
jgi:putative transposase